MGKKKVNTPAKSSAEAPLAPSEAAPAALDASPAAASEQGESAAATPSEANQEVDQQQPALSLDRLTSAFAEMLGQSEQQEESGPADQFAAASEPETELPAEGTDEDAACEISPSTILEAMLFVGSGDNRPLTARQVSELVRGVSTEEVEQLVAELNQRYLEDGCPYEITSEGAGYRLALRDEMQRVRDKFYGRVRQVTLSQAAIEVLSIVAYHQPVTKEAVNQQRGVSSGAILSQLVRRQLLRMERPEEKPRMPRYRTTDRFLKVFNMATLDDLPRSTDLDQD